ncbi:LacI family DNA-binding transcriptional regulator [Tropicibacter sp. S64]|uniref:LacI family DNA-binding transcriptional regulator n=1 Tax=Tropicibacter sp. S64 TaxID=3415122 RepID=UPI003C7ED7C5
MANPTLSDVAKAAGVSYATADRVINARGNVAEKSILKVRAAMDSLGYVRDIAAANLSRGRVYRLTFLLPSGTNAFFATMRGALSELAAHLNAERVQISTVEIAAFSGEGLVQALHAIDPETVDGLALVGITADGLEAPIATLRDHGVAVVSLVSDLRDGQRDAYVGIDNLAAGRTAARLIGMAHRGTSGVVLTIAGSLDADDHARRLQGLREVMAQDFPALTVLDPLISRDDEGRVFDGLQSALRENGAITAIYNAGAGNRGLVRALDAAAPGCAPLCVLHELVPHSRSALEAGIIHFIIDQRPQIEVTRAVAILRALIDRRDAPPMPELVPMIYVRDNIPAQSATQLPEDPSHD